MTWASVALAALVAKAEAGSVIQEVMPTGQYSAGALYGPGQLFTPASPAATLNAWTQASHQFSDLWIWLSVLAGFDIVFIASCVGLGLAFRSAPARDGEPRPSGLPRLVRGWRLLAWWPLYALALANLIQDIIAVTAFCVWIRQHRPVPAGLAWALEAAVIAKWILVIVLAAWLIYRVFTSDASPRRARQITVALKKQRFSLVIVALLAVIATGRGSDVLEQFPDVQRAWVTWPPSLGWLHLALPSRRRCCWPCCWCCSARCGCSGRAIPARPGISGMSPATGCGWASPPPCQRSGWCSGSPARRRSRGTG
jgi:hypothetical protein